MKGVMFKSWKHQFIREHPDMEIPNRMGFGFERDDGLQKVIRPRYQAGEVVFIQEAWRVGREYDALSPSGLFNHPVVAYKDSPLPFLHGAGRWRSPLFMPAWAARDFIKILAVRYERLQEITPEDIVKEGTPPIGIVPVKTAMLITGTKNLKDLQRVLSRSNFANLWDSINPKYPWKSNPWVIVYTFKKVEKRE